MDELALKCGDGSIIGIGTIPSIIGIDMSCCVMGDSIIGSNKMTAKEAHEIIVSIRRFKKSHKQKSG